MRMISMVLLAAALFAIGACTPSTQNALDKGCQSARTAYSAYTIAAEGELVPAKLQAQVNAAWKGVRVVCENPPANNEQAVLTVTSAIVVIVKAWKAID